jgi:hypothetical protein
MTGSSTAIPVVVQELFSTRLDEAVVGIAAGDLPPWHVGDEGAALLHAGQHAGYAFGALQATVVGLDQLLFAHAAWRGEHGDPTFLSDPPHPGLIGIGALLEHGRLNRVDANDVLKEVDQVLWALQPLDVAAQDDAIPTRIGELDSLTE